VEDGKHDDAIFFKDKENLERESADQGAAQVLERAKGSSLQNSNLEFVDATSLELRPSRRSKTTRLCVSQCYPADADDQKTLGALLLGARLR
jgi:hypothetical protein